LKYFKPFRRDDLVFKLFLLANILVGYVCFLGFQNKLVLITVASNQNGITLNEVGAILLHCFNKKNLLDKIKARRFFL